MFEKNEKANLTRECLGTEIPVGNKLVLPKGSPVTLMQSLGGSYTVITEEGRMVRIDGRDADALGEKFALPAAEPSAQKSDQGPFEEEKVWAQLRTVFDPEIPVNIVDLGLVYVCQATPIGEGEYKVEVKMTMTAPGCGMGGVLQEDVRSKVLSVPGVKAADVEVVWDPPWDASRMSEVARLQLGWM